jgi:hypothetical protein
MDGHLCILRYERVLLCTQEDLNTKDISYLLYRCVCLFPRIKTGNYSEINRANLCIIITALRRVLLLYGGGRKDAYRVLVGKPEGRRPLGKPKRRWLIILKWI